MGDAMARTGRAGRWVFPLGLLLTFLVATTAEDTKKVPTTDELAEYKQDFLDFDLNKDDQIDGQEVRQQFKGDLDPKELHQFFIDVDKDSTGTVTLKEYVDYAATLG
mmetsp:Transcript_21182/g.54127  ORF Transcript_21182/g.54127 Transcript_21182/m.54127 type:complete len:107 (-) Transcript_21182:26-346(-)